LIIAVRHADEISTADFCLRIVWNYIFVWLCVCVCCWSDGQSQHCKSHQAAAAECEQHPCTVLSAKVRQFFLLERW